MMIRDSLAVLAGGAALIALPGCGARGIPPGGSADGAGTRDQTGAVTSVSADELGRSRPTNVEELLRGRVAGLEIIPRAGGGYVFRIRGLNAAGAAQPEPLFVVDGVKLSPNDLESALSGLTREDIRQVDVLKDIASTSIYGMAGAGGVVVITTTRR